MKYITATISAGSKLVCNLDSYTNSEGKTDFYPLIQNSILYYRFRVITNSLSNEWRDILQAENDRWVIFKNTSLPYPIQTAALPLEAISDKGMTYLQADIPSYVLSVPGYLSITVVFTYNGKTMVTLSQDQSEADPLRILPTNNNLDRAILANMNVEDKTLYHKLIGQLAGGSQGQILVKDASAGNLSYRWADGSALTSSTYYAGTVREVDVSSEKYIIATIADTARSKMPALPDDEDEVVLVNKAIPESSTQLIAGKEYPVAGWSTWANGQFLVVGAFAFGSIALATNDYLFSNGKEWLQLPAIDRSIVEQIVADSYVPWKYGTKMVDGVEQEDTSVAKKTLHRVDISGRAATATTAMKTNEQLTVIGKTFNGSENVTITKDELRNYIDSIDKAYIDSVNIRDSVVGTRILADTQVTKAKLNANVADVYVPWDYSGTAKSAGNVNISGQAGSVKSSLSIAGKTYNGSSATSVASTDIATALDAVTSPYIDTANLRDKSVTAAKIANSTLTYDKMSANMANRLYSIGIGTKDPNTDSSITTDLYIQYFTT